MLGVVRVVDERHAMDPDGVAIIGELEAFDLHPVEALALQPV